MMIISASRRTDIPAFYSKWFMERIRQGYYIKVNPFNSKQRKIVSLRQEDVDCIVFWTKYPKLLMEGLYLLDEWNYRYYFQFTLNDYPQVIEPHLPSIYSRINVFQQLSKQIGKEKVIWRFDPIIYSSITPLEYVKERFEYIASELQGYTNRVVISFVDLYGKTKNRFKNLEQKYRITFYDLLDEKKRLQLYQFANDLSTIAKKYGLEIYSCAERVDLETVGIQHGACIDLRLIEDIFCHSLKGKKDPYQRKECLCAASEEMGIYDTCPYYCSYCYATRSEKTVQKNLEKHNWQSPLLVGEAETDFIP